MTGTERTMSPLPPEKLYPGDALELMDRHSGRDDFVLIDVSTPWEFKGRHLENAVNVSFISPLFASRIGRFNRDHTYLLTCKVGCRSQMARQVMKKMGFQSVSVITGGHLMWEEEGLPFSGSGKVSRFSLCPMTFAIKTKRRIRRWLGMESQTKDSENGGAGCLSICGGGDGSASPKWWQGC